MAINIKKRLGQIWIDGKVPHTLKFYGKKADGADGNQIYTIVPLAPYLTREGTEFIPKGTVMALDPDDSNLTARPARFPEDLNNVIGITISPFSSKTDTGSKEIEILTSGYITFNSDELKSAFVTSSDFKVAGLTSTNKDSAYTDFGNATIDDGAGGNGWGIDESYPGTGAPVYWYIGRVVKLNSGFRYHDVHEKVYKDYTITGFRSDGVTPIYGLNAAAHEAFGKLTFATPSGYKYPPSKNLIPWGDETLNIQYNNLPTIGNVASYNYNDESGEITKLTVHVFLSRFNSTIGFTYPNVPEMPADTSREAKSYNELSLKKAREYYTDLFENKDSASEDTDIATIREPYHLVLRHGLSPDVNDELNLGPSSFITSIDASNSDVYGNDFNKNLWMGPLHTSLDSSTTTNSGNDSPGLKPFAPTRYVWKHSTVNAVSTDYFVEKIGDDGKPTMRDDRYTDVEFSGNDDYRIRVDGRVDFGFSNN